MTTHSVVDDPMVEGALVTTAWQIGQDVAGPAAAEVDRDARFPQESREALAGARLFSALVPRELGGMGASLPEVAGAVRAIAFHCTSSALMLAMHSIEAAQLAAFGTTPGLTRFAEELAERQLLIANANSEVGVGGDATRSLCHLEPDGDRLRLRKQALACSYGEHADVISATARRSADAPEDVQAVALMRREDIAIERTRDWDTVGLRGTCSTAINIDASVDPELIYEPTFAALAEGGTLLRSLVLLSSVWVGLAESAFSLAHRQVRVAARKNIGTIPPSALRLAEVETKLAAARGALHEMLADYASAAARDRLVDTTLLVKARALKVLTSRTVVEIAGDCLAVCGIVAYQRSGPQSMDRIVRDAHGSVLMVSNDRYLNANAQALTLLKEL